MKPTFLSLLVVFLLASCVAKETQQSVHPDFLYPATMYELNTRQFTPEGTFAAATDELSRLQELGVDIIWVMPIQPIGELERKGTLGSYYAIRDYCAFNPEFGTRADFEAFVAEAHHLGMKVILDWVANHTSPDHPWTQNEDWHLRDSVGKLVVNYDWFDIAELNYDNAEMRTAMKQAMHWWVDEVGVDGFRCDMAMLVPTDFWESTFAEIRIKHPEFISLCEAEETDLVEQAFNMYYGWEMHHLLNAVAQEKKTTADLWAYFEKADTLFSANDMRLNFTSNHDENSWAGTEFERMGAAAEAMAAFTYIVPGIPLIYTGQEYGSDKRLQFFEKDTIAINPAAPQQAFYHKMNTLRAENKALWGNELGGEMEALETNQPDVFACVRSVEGNTVIALFNFSAQVCDVQIKVAQHQGKYYDKANQLQHIDDTKLFTLPAWGYEILSNEQFHSDSQPTTINQ